MTAQKKIKIIQIICWAGAAADSLWVVALIWPAFYSCLTGNLILQTDVTLRLIMGVAASLMAGWTVLLVWVSKDPIARRSVLLFTAFPAIAGLSVVTLWDILNGSTTNIWILFKCVFLGLAMLWGYYLAGTMAGEGTDAIID